MSVIRHHGRRPEDGFTMIENATIRRGDLSLKALGVLMILLSHEDGFNLSTQRLASGRQEGRHAILSAMQELQDAGFVRYRREGLGRGRIRTVTDVYRHGDAPPESGLRGPDDR